MKPILFLISLCVSLTSFSQTINQFNENGERHGVWKKNFENTNVLRYEGTFNNGQEEGVFKFYKNIKGKAVLTATKAFEPNTNKAKVTFFSSSGKIISEGTMREKTYIGTWKYYHSNGKQLMTLEHYNNEGRLEGERLVYYPSGVVAEKSLYKNGQLHGKSAWYNEAGTLIKMYHYNMDLLHGLAQFYDNSGNLLQEGNYRNDKKHGIWKYYENGALKEEKDFTIKSKNPYKNKD
ncbi:toxin-antitoxin system YwqK family antitoxin [Bizionia sediminis]|uniref:Toxin-antitoxin system YwqK family antitoxin n=1 Tax=Bizionia sediminis TaxID=1737064 RepID=A0ABW5KMZ4_9FLAO